jgi:hypothetical protein
LPTGVNHFVTRFGRVPVVATAGCRLQILANPETAFDRWLRHEIH